MVTDIHKLDSNILDIYIYLLKKTKKTQTLPPMTGQAWFRHQGIIIINPKYTSSIL